MNKSTKNEIWNEDGFQVLLSVYNAEKFLKMCLDSLEKSLRGHKWILLIGNDCSTDGSLMEIVEYIPKSSAQKVHFFNFNKADTVGQAKNKLIKESHRYKSDYPAILMMDADDQMRPERPNMLKTAKKYNSEYVVGCWTRLKQEKVPEKYGWDKVGFKTAEGAVSGLFFGPWATLFHCDLLPEDGKFFPEDKVTNCGFEDLLTWLCLKHFEDVKPIPHIENNEPVHVYYVHTESVSNTQDTEKVTFQRNSYWALKEMIENDKRNIIKDPPTEKELHKGIAKYVLRKQYENAKKKNMEPPSPIPWGVKPLGSSNFSHKDVGE